MAYYLGVDSGGSKTTCVVGDEKLQLGIAMAGPSNITRVGEARAGEALLRAIREACAGAGITPGQVSCASIGAAGAGRDQRANAVRRIIAELIPGRIEVVGDMQIALAAAFGGGPGVIVIAGTGSIAYGRDREGRTARAGGWGFAISDEGSAHWIGRTAVSTLVRSVDEENEQVTAELSPLYRELSAALKASSLDEFVRTANSTTDFAALFPALLAAERCGDPLARSVLTRAASELAQIAAIVVDRLFAKQSGSGSVAMAMAGGVFRHSETVRGAFCDELHKINAFLKVMPEIVEPVLGALQLARRLG